MLLSPLCNISRFIGALVKNNYDGTLSTLLHDLEIDESPDDIAKLLSGYIPLIINKIGTERAITICDELCASFAINYMITNNVVLDKLSVNQVINYKYADDHINAYNHGYRLVSQSMHSLYAKCTRINNAYDNGLYAPYVEFDLYIGAEQCVLDDIQKVIVSDVATLALCKNAEDVTIFCDQCYDDDFVFPAQNIKILTITENLRSGVLINKFLAQFINIHTLDIDRLPISSSVQLTSALRILRADFSNLSDCGIIMCTYLKVLHASDNPYITTCNVFAKTLIRLDASKACGITDNGLLMCDRLKILDVHANKRVTTCEPFAKTLRQLDASNGCGIADAGLRLCNRLKILNADRNSKITTCSPFGDTLISLYARNYNCRIGDTGLTMCKHLRILYATSNPNITTCAPFKQSLEILYANGVKCGITDDGVSTCTNIRILNADENYRICQYRCKGMPAKN